MTFEQTSEENSINLTEKKRNPLFEVFFAEEANVKELPWYL